MEDLLGYLHVVVLPQVIDALIIGVALALVALGLTMIFGLLDVINLAHGDLYMLGGYAAFTLLGWGAGYWGALVLVPILVGLVGWGLEELGIRPLLPRADRAIVTLLLTFGGSLVLRDIAQVVWGTETHAVAPPSTASWGSPRCSCRPTDSSSLAWPSSRSLPPGGWCTARGSAPSCARPQSIRRWSPPSGSQSGGCTA